MTKARCRKRNQKKTGAKTSRFSCQEPAWLAMSEKKKAYIWRRHKEGATPLEIFREIGVHFQTIERLIANGEIVARNLNETYRCSSCGCTVTTHPCLACKLRGEI